MQKNEDGRFMITQKQYTRWQLGITLLSIIFACVALFYNIHQPILEHHGFRQTQTAISAYWMLHGGPWFFYQTPVLGYPWSIPFEFPLYQWIVALMHQLTHINLDICGRFISIIFYILSLFILKSWIKQLKFEGTNHTAWIFCILFLTSPTYLFWSRTFMIESISLFLSATYLLYCQQFINRQHWLYFALTLLFGSLAILVKVTTFYPFCLLSAGMIVIDWHKKFGYKLPIQAIKYYLPMIFFAVIPFILLLAWTHYSDVIKMHNELGQNITASALTNWNFGTLHQRLSNDFWIDTVLGKSMLGIGPGIIIGLIIGIMKRKDIRVLFGVFCAFLFLIPDLTFTNLHIIHEYYDYENIVFLIIGISFILSTLSPKDSKALPRLILFIVIAQIIIYLANYGRIINKNTFDAKDYKIGQFIAQNTAPKTFILVYGIDWSSSIGYYSKRKSLTDPLWGNATGRLENLNHYTGGLKLSAIVQCPSAIDKDTKALQLMSQYTQKFKQIEISGCRVRYLPKD